MVLFVGRLISESITLDYSKWSGFPVSETFDYPENSDFHDFLFAIGHQLYGGNSDPNRGFDSK